MATHSRTSAWKIPWQGSCGLQSMRSRPSEFTSLTSCFISGEGNGNPLLYSCLENPMDRGAWRPRSMRCRVGHDCSDWAHIYSHICMRVCRVASVMFDSATPGTVAQQASLSGRFSRQEHCSALRALLQRTFPTPGSNLRLLLLLPCRWVLCC